MVELRTMDDSEFQAYRTRTVHDYAVEKTVAGTWGEEEAASLSEQAISQLLPEGLATKDAFLYTVLDAAEGTPIGNLWVQFSESKKGREAFIFDIVIHEAYQGKGFGKQTLQALDEKAREQGAVSIGLHVFGHNRRAYGLYQKMGYETTDMVMRKKL
ncbi:acetyltransferase (GNAT) family protein [Fontibacillus phaseoli]|uniref:Acetyltransferase (GNAT) family protein n=1 Tax=Fontibacillus phaseoli TaxID=1416533 RepID=A0A369BF98_9BACL|nr:GNAT family N-acetyltransferase [Fontibacillus phaseoli]RCX19157.1 acetyltransferase (GNAT) family protein [Fontibacillus phaseoli]